MSAIVLTGAVGFTACSSSEDATEPTTNVNPTYDGSSVRTDFAFNVSKASNGATRMTAKNTQNDNSFRGMSNMYLFPFSEEPAANKTTNLTSPNVNYSLGALTNTEISTSNSKKIYSLTLPIGTSDFLFYGTATRNSENNFNVGRLTSSFYNVNGDKASGADNVANTNGINFNLAPIATDLGADATNLAAYLTNIAKATNWAETVNYVNGTTSVTNPDAYVSLADLYTKFTTIYTDRCGSAEAIYRTIVDLYKSAKAINGQSSVANVQAIATAICDAIKDNTSTVHMTIVDSATDPEQWTFTWVGLTDTAFPTSLNLPMGAVQLTFDPSSKNFAYKNSTTATDLSSFGIKYTDICYPSELVYFDNSPLRATDVYKTQSDYKNTPSEWDIQFQATSGDWIGTSVTPATRAVAMKNNVNYGVSMLESTVKLQTENLTDNRSAILGGSATNQDDIVGTAMKVTGILIGGQPGTVGWNMVANSATGFDKVIYDNDVKYGNALSTSESTHNYTIVLDNLKGDGTDPTTPATTQDDVKFALQIKNGSQDFYGQTGMIPANSTFYLIGTLSASSPSTARDIPNVNTGSSTVKRNTVYRITHEDKDRVFVQDYKTRANITIAADALKKAYSTIPDLRSTELLFGLSVDLSWEAGAVYNVTIN